MAQEERFGMRLNQHPGTTPVMHAAMVALNSGNVNDILSWIPEEYENTVKNLFEKTLCEQRTGNDGQGISVNWYLHTVNQLCCAGDREPSDVREKRTVR